jgi:hypothetical protein
MKWAVALTLAENETIESRLRPIVSYLSRLSPSNKYLIRDIDANGKMGDQMTQRMNIQREGFLISEEEISTLVSEDGQVIELNLFILNSNEFRVIVRDGSSIDILGNEKILPQSVLGEHKDLDIGLFRSHNQE